MSENTSAAEWLRGIIGRYEDEAVGLNGNCSTMTKMFGIVCKEETCRTCMVKMMTAIADRIDAERALPDGMEWPRFEDGEMVKFGDEVEYKGETMRVYLATFDADGWALWCSREGIDGRLSGSYGERVKRHAPKVLDADGVPIEVGDTVWATYNGCKHIVTAVCSDGSLHPERVTDDGCMVEYEGGLWDFAKKVTHEQPDSWEKLEKDARKTACAYAPAPLDEDGLTTCDGCPFLRSESCSNEMTIDLVERAKKLAGIEEEARNDQ